LRKDIVLVDKVLVKLLIIKLLLNNLTTRNLFDILILRKAREKEISLANVLELRLNES